MLILGPAWFCEAAGKDSLSPASLPVPEGAAGGHLAAGQIQRLPGQEAHEAQERRYYPPAGSHQGHARQKSPRKEEKKCKFNSC